MFVVGPVLLGIGTIIGIKVISIFGQSIAMYIVDRKLFKSNTMHFTSHLLQTTLSNIIQFVLLIVMSIAFRMLLSQYSYLFSILSILLTYIIYDSRRYNKHSMDSSKYAIPTILVRIPVILTNIMIINLFFAGYNYY